MKPALFLRSLLMLAVCAAFVSPGRAQNPLGALRGSVQDASGARIAGAGISATNTEKSLTRSVRSDAQGEFRIEDILRAPINWWRMPPDLPLRARN
jgi:hypothetical protein